MTTPAERKLGRARGDDLSREDARSQDSGVMTSSEMIPGRATSARPLADDQNHLDVMSSTECIDYGTDRAMKVADNGRSSVE